MKILITYTFLKEQPDGRNIRQHYEDKGKRFGILEKLRLATWNVRGLNKKETELNQHLRERNVNIAVITETKKKLKGTMDLENYTMIYSGVEQSRRACCGVAILIDNKWKRNIKSYTFVNERIITVRLKTNRGQITIIGVYAPEEGKKDETKVFYEQLQKEVKKYNNTDSLIIAGDLNARVGKQPIPHVVGCFGEEHLNENGRQLRDFATYNDLKITNTFFRKKDIHKYTWSARGYRSLIDYVIANPKIAPQFRDTKVYRGSDIYSDHFLVVSEIEILARWRKQKRTDKKTQEEVFKIHLLQEESVRRLYQTRLTEQLMLIPTTKDIEEEWKILKHTMLKIAYETLGKRKNYKRKKGLKIWNEEIQEAIEEKQKAYKNYLQNPTDQAKDQYKIKRNISKAIVRKAHEESWERFISNIEHDIHGRQTIAYKIIKHLNSSERDIARINTIQEQEWITHYKELWHDQSLPLIPEEHTMKAEVDLIEIKELEEALLKTKNRKATGLDGVNAELFKYGGTLLKFRFLHLINMCWTSYTIPQDWKKAKVISLFKKGDRSNVDNYRGISLLNVAYKIYSKIINTRLQNISDVILLEDQAGFRKGRSCIDDVFTLKQIIAKRVEYNLETHLVFVDYEKAFDKVSRETLWHIMTRRGFPRHLIEVIKSLYEGTKIVIDSGNKLSEEININRGVRQGCSLSPSLFNIYIDDLIRKWKGKVSEGIQISQYSNINNMLFADDQVIIQTSEDELQRATYKLHLLSAEYNMKISLCKTKTMAFLGKYPVRTKIVLDGHVLEQVSHFQYLGCCITYEEDQDLTTKTNKFQAICGTIRRTLNKKARAETQMKFYKVMATPTLLYGSETWVTKKKELSRLQAAEMRFLRSVKGCTREDRIRNEDIRKELNANSIVEQIERNKTKWKEHVLRMERGRTPREALAYNPRGRRSVGRPRKRW